MLWNHFGNEEQTFSVNAADCFPYQFFGVPPCVPFRCIDVCEARIDGSSDGCYRLGVTGGVRLRPSAEAPGAESERWHCKTVSEPFFRDHYSREH